MSEIPTEIREAAAKLYLYFEIEGIRKWQLDSICSRNYAYQLEEAIKLLERCRDIQTIPHGLYEDIQNFLN